MGMGKGTVQELMNHRYYELVNVKLYNGRLYFRDEP